MTADATPSPGPVPQSDAPQTDTGLRARKKNDTRRAIRTAALDLAVEVGLDALTVDEIAARAQVSPRTFFNYFAHKEDALVMDAAAGARTLQPLIVGRPADESPLHAIRAVITETDLFSVMNSDRERTLARQRLVAQHPVLLARQLSLNAQMENLLAVSVATRMGVDPAMDPRPAHIGGVAGAAMRGAIDRWAADGTTLLSDRISAAFDLLENGLLTDGGADVQTDDPTVAIGEDGDARG
jgi:AcrR family transcriptional regulator